MKGFKLNAVKEDDECLTLVKASSITKGQSINGSVAIKVFNLNKQINALSENIEDSKKCLEYFMNNLKDTNNNTIESMISDDEFCSLLSEANTLNKEIQENTAKLQELKHTADILNLWMSDKNIKFALSFEDIQNIMMEAQDFNILDLEDKVIKTKVKERKSDKTK